MENNTVAEEVETVPGILDAGRRRALRKIAVAIGALAGLSVLPEQWTRPLIGHIVIPAHAATSGEVVDASPEPEVIVPCSLVTGCYQILSGPDFVGDYIGWMSDAPFLTPPIALVEVLTDCSDGALRGFYQAVVARSPEEAMAIFAGAGAPPGPPDAVFTVIGLPPGCSIYGINLGG